MPADNEENSKQNLHVGHRRRMRERCIKYGFGNFNDIQMLEFLLFYAIPRKDTNELAHDLLNRFKTLPGVFCADISHLREVKGMTESAVLLINAVGTLMSKNDFLYSSELNLKFTDLDSLGEHIVTRYSGIMSEKVMVFSINSSSVLNAEKTLYYGSFFHSVLNLSEITSFAKKNESEYIVLSHNHPSGSSSPSPEDLESTKYTYEILSKVGIKLAEHFIISKGKYTPIMRDNPKIFKNNLFSRF